MKMLNDRMINCIDYSLPSGDYAITGAFHHRFLSNSEVSGFKPNFVIRNAYHIIVECWDRRTGACHLHHLYLAYRRAGYVSSGEWICYKHELDLRHPTTKSRYRDSDGRENDNLSLGKVSSDDRHVAIVDCL